MYMVIRVRTLFKFSGRAFKTKHSRNIAIVTSGRQYQSRGLGKLGHQEANFWLKKRTIHGTLNIFLGIKLFFVKIEI